jgi:hypothetical protein
MKEHQFVVIFLALVMAWHDDELHVDVKQG